VKDIYSFSAKVVRARVSKRSGYEDFFTWVVLPEGPSAYGIPRYTDAQYVQMACREAGRAAELVEVIDIDRADKLGPVEIFRRPLNGVVGGVGNLTPMYEPLPRVVNVSEVEPLPDGQFWAIIAASPSATAVKKSLRDPEVAAAFQVALDVKLHELDHPDNAVRTRVGSQSIMSDDASLAWRTAIVMAGEATYLDALASPGSHLGKGRSFRAEPLLMAASRAVSKPGDPVILHSGIPQVTGANTAHWSVRPTNPNPPRDPRKIWQSRLTQAARARGVSDPGADPWYRIEDQKSWYAVHALYRDGAADFEYLGIHTRPQASMRVESETVAQDQEYIREQVQDFLPRNARIEIEPSAAPTNLARLARLKVSTR